MRHNLVISENDFHIVSTHFAFGFRFFLNISTEIFLNKKKKKVNIKF